MKTTCHPFLAALAATATFTGCTTTPVLHPPETELRASLGRVAVVALTDSSRIRFQVPDSKADLAAEKLEMELVTPRMIARKAGPVGGGPEAALVGAVAVTTPLLVMGGAPLWQELRRAYGTAVADRANDVATARATLDAAVTRVRLNDELRDRLAAELNQEAPAFTAAPTRGGADTILELFIYEPNVSSRTGEGINPALGLSLGVRVRLLDARSGAELYYDYLDYRGPTHRFVEWAARDARVFNAELERCLAHLSAEIVAQLFTRPPEAIADPGSLAALGIGRRPPTPLMADGGSLWSPPRSRAVYARN